MRIEKVNELIGQEVAKIISEEFEFGEGVMVTVMSVDTSSKLETATLYISVFPEDKATLVLEKLDKDIGGIQNSLNKKLSLKFVPKIFFKIDKSEAYAENIDKLLSDIKEGEH